MPFLIVDLTNVKAVRKNFSEEQFQSILQATGTYCVDYAIKKMTDPVSSWTYVPQFQSTVYERSSRSVKFEVTTDDQMYTWVDLGTQAHFIVSKRITPGVRYRVKKGFKVKWKIRGVDRVFKGGQFVPMYVARLAVKLGYTSKTQLGGQSTVSGGKGLVFPMFVNHPGITARNITKKALMQVDVEYWAGKAVDEFLGTTDAEKHKRDVEAARKAWKNVLDREQGGASVSRESVKSFGSGRRL
jgi:hypothetical protein